MIIEEIAWIKCSDELPDDDTTVLIYGTGSEPVWLAYYGQTDEYTDDDGNKIAPEGAWFSIDGEELVEGSATWWAPMPTGPE